MNMQGSKDLQNGTAGVTIKVEPGTSTQRLPSLKPPRDLSLSAFKSKLSPSIIQNNLNAKKKVFTPNLNVQRNRQRENAVTIKEEPKEVKRKVSTPERGRGRGKKGQLIQLNSGLFSEGLAPSLKTNRFGRSSLGGGGDAGDKTLQKPKLIKQENIKVDKAEESLMLKELLRDDFVDDPNLEPDYADCPLKLAFNDRGIFSIEKKIKTEPGFIDNDPNSKGDFVKQIKIEPGLENDIRGNSTDVKLKLDEKDCEMKIPKEPTIYEVMVHKEEPQFALIQMPTCMPGLKPDVDTRQGSSSTVQPDSQNSSKAAETEQVAPNIEESYCKMQTLKPGKIGKLEILKSGRCRLILGDTKLWLEMGTQIAFRQDLISVNVDQNTSTGSTTCMGSFPIRMIAIPDWNHMIKSEK